MKYQNKRNGKIAIDVTQTVEQKEKYKTVTLTFEDGSVQDITTATFKRWYKKIEDDVEVVEQTEDTKVETDDAYVAEVMKQKEELGIDVPELNPDDVEIVDVTPIAYVKNWLLENNIIFKTSRDGIRVFKADGKTRIMEIWKRKRCVRVYINANDNFALLDKTLIQRETKTSGQVAKRYDTSLYVPVENIDKVFSVLITK